MPIENQKESVLLDLLSSLEDIDEDVLAREREPDRCRSCRCLLTPEINDKGVIIYFCFDCDD